MLRAIISFLFIALLAQPALAHAECREGKTGQTIGTVAGAIGGGLLGRALGGKRNRGAGTVAGVALGAFVGNRLGKALDKCEQKKLADATQTALNSNGSDPRTRPTTWTSDSRPNVSGNVAAGPVIASPDGRVCRSVTRVNYVDGQEMQDKPTFCRVPPNTAWTMAG